MKITITIEYESEEEAQEEVKTLAGLRRSNGTGADRSATTPTTSPLGDAVANVVAKGVGESRQAIAKRLAARDPQAAGVADDRLPDHAPGSLLWTTVFALAALPDGEGFEPEKRAAAMYPLAEYLINDLGYPHKKGADVLANSLSGMRSTHAMGKGYSLFVAPRPNWIGLG